MKTSKNHLTHFLFIATWFFLLGTQICCNLPKVKKNLVPQPFQTRVQIIEEQTIPIQNEIINEVTEEQISESIMELSGAQPVLINGQETNINSRYSYAMFLDYPEAAVVPYLTEQVSRWVPEEKIEIDPYTYTDAEQSYTWENIIVQIPGNTTPEEKILLTAHFDSTVVSGGNALQYAPGADDNASGTAVLLEAICIFSEHSFEKTIEIVFFSGEEEGAYGSRAYLADHPDNNIKAVINVDMIGYDSDNDACMEIHAGNNLESQNIASALQQTNIQYNLGLQTDILTTLATDRSDHASFWSKNIPAVLIMENFLDTTTSGICTTADPNPNYHRIEDTIDQINISYVTKITQLVLITTANLAIPVE